MPKIRSIPEDPEYTYCQQWLLVKVDLSALEEKYQRLNITWPDALLLYIDFQVKQPSSGYQDRRHFLAMAAQHELLSARNNAPGG